MASSEERGANHGDQDPFPTYDAEIRGKSETLTEVAGVTHAYWTSFVTAGDPNQVPGRYGARPAWPASRASAGGGMAGTVVVFGAGTAAGYGGRNKGVVVQVKDDTAVTEECKFWWERTELFEL